MESEAPPSTGWYNFLGWLDVNRKRVAMGAVIVVIVAGVITILAWRHSEREGEGAEALAAIKHNPNEPPPAGLPEQFLKVANEYPKTPAGAQALLRAGAAYFDAGQFQKAQETFTSFLRTYGDSPWVAQAQYGLGACLEAEGKMPEAIAKYNDFLKNYANDPAAEEARFSLARLYEKSSQPAQAIDVLTKMTNGLPPFSPVLGEVQDRLRAIYTRNPSLIPVPPRPAQTTFTPSMLTNVVRTTNRPAVLTSSVVRPGPAPTVTPTPAPSQNPPATTATGAAPKIQLQLPPQGTQPAK